MPAAGVAFAAQLVRGAAFEKDAPRGAFLASAVTRLEERFGTGAVLTGAEASEREASRRMSLGIASLDALLDGGLLAGEPLALLGAPTSGALTLALEAAAAAQARGGEVAWLDPSRSFDPLAAARLGVDLARLLLLRVAGDEIPFTATTVARSAAFVLLVIDLGPRFAQRCSIGALAPVVAQGRAAGVATLVLAERAERSIALPSVELRRTGWVRQKEAVASLHAGRVVGWRSLARCGYRAEVARLSFAPLALPSAPLVDEGLRTMPRVMEEAG